MSEEWRDVVGLEGRYLVSSLGRVKGGPALRGYNRAKSGYNKAEPSNRGYERVTLTGHDGKLRKYSIHSLVAAAFLGPRPAGMEVNHKDGDKGRNAAENLEYCTRRENERHAYRSGLKERCVGDGHYAASLTSEWVTKIRRLARDGMTRPEIGKLYGLNRQAVYRILSGRSWARAT